MRALNQPALPCSSAPSAGLPLPCWSVTLPSQRCQILCSLPALPFPPVTVGLLPLLKSLSTRLWRGLTIHARTSGCYQTYFVRRCS